jgi:2-haloacid dehalogenase
MTRTEELRREVHVLTFDIFETVLDLEGSLERAFEDYFERKGVETDVSQFYRRYQQYLVFIQMTDAHTDTPRVPFKDLCRRSLAYQLDLEGVDYTESDLYELLDVWWSLEYHPEVPDALDRLSDEFTIVALSSGDRDILEASLDPNSSPEARFEFDEIVSAGEARTYKPAPEPYEIVLDKYDIAPNEVMHVAAHAFDIVAPKAASLRACYVDRGSRPYGEWDYDPDLTVGSIGELAGVLTSGDT